MNTTKNTVLITGGSAGIGFEIAKQLSVKGNHVIITGRDEHRLRKAAAQLPEATAIKSDVSDAADVKALVKKLQADFPALNMVINNAGRAHLHDLVNGTGAFEKANDEFLTNYFSVVRLNEELLPLLKKQTEAAIVNVSSVVSLVPNHNMAGYGASKAALHSYSQSLRIALGKATNVKVFELMPPLVNTEFSTEIGGERGIPPSQVADDLIKALEENIYEIHVGQTAYIYELSRTSPAEALLALNPA